MKAKFHIILIVIIVPVLFFSCSSSEPEPFYRMIQNHKNTSAIPQLAEIQSKNKRKFVNPQFTYDTFFISTHKPADIPVYYMAAELIHKGIQVYRILLIWEIDPLLYVLIGNKPYGKNSWSYIAWLTNPQTFRQGFHPRPLKGEEFKKIKSMIASEYPQVNHKKYRNYGKKK